MKSNDGDRGLRTIQARIDGAVSQSGPGYSLTRNGVGNYTLRFVPPFRAPPSVVAISDSAGFCAMATMPGGTAAGTDIRAWVSGPALADSSFYLVVTGRPL